MTFRIGSSGVPLCARKCNFGFHKEQGMFWPAKKLWASQRGFSFMELVIYQAQ
jgi:hypothetical protein